MTALHNRDEVAKLTAQLAKKAPPDPWPLTDGEIAQGRKREVAIGAGSVGAATVLGVTLGWLGVGLFATFVAGSAAYAMFRPDYDKELEQHRIRDEVEDLLRLRRLVRPADVQWEVSGQETTGPKLILAEKERTAEEWKAVLDLMTEFTQHTPKWRQRTLLAAAKAAAPELRRLRALADSGGPSLPVWVRNYASRADIG